MLRIRFRRAGRAHDPFYRIVVAEETMPIQGKYVAQIGHYNPKTKALVLDKEEALGWMNKGAKPSNTVSKLMKKEKISHNSIVIHKTRSVSKKELAAQKVAEEAQKIKTQEEKEAAKEAWEKESSELAAENPSSDEKLVEEVEEIEPKEVEIKETPETTDTAKDDTSNSDPK